MDKTAEKLNAFWPAMARHPGKTDPARLDTKNTMAKIRGKRTMKLVKKQPLALAVCLFLMLGLLSTSAMAADSSSHIYVGGVELTGSADEPAYATTDGSGKVTPGGSEDNYNVKWDGKTLTLNGANVTGRYSYVDHYGDPNSAAIYRDGALEVILVGKNTVTGPDADSDSELNNGIAAMGNFTISGGGSLEATGGYDAITAQNGDMAILSGQVMAVGGSSAISVYDGDLNISGGEVTATATGSYFDVSFGGNLAYGIYVYGDCTVSGGKVTTTGQADSSGITNACGIFVFGSGKLTISGGEFVAAATGEYGDRFGIDSFDGAVISGGTVTATGGYAGIFTHSSSDGDITIEGSVVTATSVDENGYGIYARTNVIIKDGTVTATAAEEGGYGICAEYGDVAISGGEVTTTGEEAGLRSQSGDITVAPREGWQITVNAGADKDSAAAIDGSPFGAEAAISDMLDSMKHCRFVSSSNGQRFTDVAVDSWYYDGVEYVYAAGLMIGTGDYVFSPDVVASRSAVIVSLWRMAGSPVVNYLMDFTDVDPEAWYGEAIRWAVSEGIAGGYGGRQFGPNDPVTWEQLAVMLWRYAGSPDAAADMSGCVEDPSISDWAQQAMAWSVEQGIIDCSTLSPQSTVTRAQMAVVLQKFCQLEW